ncbi:hypothetical protein [Citrobacter farmeri]|uniref:hypothetical protein n=1 Tax=Citrobacter farmeri TaxID=67824 RepID=UPI0018AB6F38|nr:hypothetical protein [Citrobacter farmeri]MDB2182113.1 hypothetical protein [Citrobacter farmeri]
MSGDLKEALMAIKPQVNTEVAWSETDCLSLIQATTSLYRWLLQVQRPGRGQAGNQDGIAEGFASGFLPKR